MKLGSSLSGTWNESTLPSLECLVSSAIDDGNELNLGEMRADADGAAGSNAVPNSMRAEGDPNGDERMDNVDIRRVGVRGGDMRSGSGPSA